MKKVILLLVIFVAVSALAVGCDDEAALSLSDGNGMVDSKQQRRRRVAMIMDMNDRMIQDDIDETWFFDANSKLMPWEVYVGN
ncbi:MAG: hypothetical protein DRP83_06935 [Planctomycetota bacterium]|nr:MAG: hypothetical protein DRP83_06935 [Planctomycetota bacterium]